MSERRIETAPARVPGFSRERDRGVSDVRILRQEEKELTIPLYAECFPEDSDRMRDCYYRTKMRENTVFALLPAGMLCLNPYRVSFAGQELWLSYIVAVSTAARFRRRGVMRRLLTAALRELWRRGEAFTFLKPADTAYYLPFGFRFFSGRKERQRTVLSERLLCERIPAAEFCGTWMSAAQSPGAQSPGEQAPGEQAPGAQAGEGITLREMDGFLRETAEFLNRYLEERYEVFCLRDPHYLLDLFAELEAEDGEMLRFRDPESGEIMGVIVRDTPDAADGDTRMYLPEAVTEPARTAAVTEPAGTAAAWEPAEGKEAETPFFMGRITNLPAFLSLFSAEGPEEIRLRFRYEDPLIPENEGVWCWTPGGPEEAGKGPKSFVRKETAAEEAAEELTGGFSKESAGLPVFSSGTLFPWLLGYEEDLPEALSVTGGRERADWLRIRRIRGVYFDEEM